MEIFPQRYIQEDFCSSPSSSMCKMGDLTFHGEEHELRRKKKVKYVFLQTEEFIPLACLGEMLLQFLTSTRAAKHSTERYMEGTSSLHPTGEVQVAEQLFHFMSVGKSYAVIFPF